MMFKAINYLKSKIKKNGLLIIETQHQIMKYLKNLKISNLNYKFIDRNDFRYKQNLGLFEKKNILFYSKKIF